MLVYFTLFDSLLVDRLNDRTERMTKHRESQEVKLTAVRKKNKKKVMDLEKFHEVTVEKIQRDHSNIKIDDEKNIKQIKKEHSAILHHVQSDAFKSSREANKTIVNLQSELTVTQDSNLLNQTELTTKNEQLKEVKRQCIVLETSLRNAQKEHKSVLKQEQAKRFQESRRTSKQIINLQTERDSAVDEKHNVVINQDISTCAEVKNMKQKERKHYSTIVAKEKEKSAALKLSLQQEQNSTTSLLNRTITAEWKLSTAIKESKQSARRSKELTQVIENYKSKLNDANMENETMRRSLCDLQDLLDASESKLSLMDAAIPIKQIKKTRASNKGRPSWPLYMWDLILEQLVNGTPPSSVNDNIVAHVKKFSPTTDIVDLPSIWTIRRARTVLLIICQTLAAYRLSKADKWDQLFTDATSRRQVSFQNLVISIEEDDLFR